MTGQSAGASPTRHDGDRIPRAPRTKAGQSLAARAKRESWGNWEGIAQFVIPAIEDEASAAPPEPPPLDCGRLARAIDEHIESDCPRDTACDGTCADSIAERYGGAAPESGNYPPKLDRLPSVDEAARLLRHCLSVEGIVDNRARRDTVAWLEEYEAAAPPEPPALDVERLAQAWHATQRCVHGKGSGEPLQTPGYLAPDREVAADIIAEYGGAAPDRLPSVEDLAGALRAALSKEIVWRPGLHADPWRYYAEQVRASLHEGTAPPREAER